MHKTNQCLARDLTAARFGAHYFRSTCWIISQRHYGYSVTLTHCSLISSERGPRQSYAKTFHKVFCLVIWYRKPKGTSIRQAPVFRHLRALRKSPLSGWMNYNYTACCWFPISSNILILPSQFWQIRFESCWLSSSKCRILVLLRYMMSMPEPIKHMQNTYLFILPHLELFFSFFHGLCL